MRRMPHDRGGWSGDSRTASGFSGAPRIAPRKRRGRTRTRIALGGAQNRTGRPRPGGYAAPNPSKINGSIFIILGLARRANPEGEGARVENRPGRRRTTRRTTQTGRRTTLAPSTAGLFCAPPSPSIINMYLFFHFNLDCGAEQPPVCRGRVGRGRNSPPPEGGWGACVCA